MKDIEFINPDNPVYISYSRNDEDHPELENKVKELCELMEKRGINYLLDKKNCNYRDNINEFEKAIGCGMAVVVVASDKYYQSPHTMTEWHYIVNKNDIQQRVFSILLDDKIKDEDNCKKYREQWEDKFNKAIEEYKKCYDQRRNTADLPATTQNIHNFSGFIRDFDILHKFVKDNVRVEKVEDIIESLVEYVTQLSEPAKLKKENPILKEEIKHLKNENDNLKSTIKSLKQRVIVFNEIGIPFKMIRIDSGKLAIGGKKIDLPDYYIGETQVTQELWETIMQYNDSHFDKGGKYPVESISYFDALLFCNKLSEKLKKDKVYEITNIKYDAEKIHIMKANIKEDDSKNGFRLPKTNEWKFAAQCGENERLAYSGSNEFDNVAWFKNNSYNSTHEVKSKCCNEFGLYDMSGNVWEWCDEHWCCGGSYQEDQIKKAPCVPNIGFRLVMQL